MNAKRGAGMEYRIGPEEAGWRVREVLRRSMGVSYTALKSLSLIHI